jgi:hypothetical protein
VLQFSGICFALLQEDEAAIEVESFLGQYGLWNNAATKRFDWIDPQLCLSAFQTASVEMLLTWLICIDPRATLLS